MATKTMLRAGIQEAVHETFKRFLAMDKVNSTEVAAALTIAAYTLDQTIEQAEK